MIGRYQEKVRGGVVAIALWVSLGLVGITAYGQQATEPSKKEEPQKATAQTHPNNPELWNTEQMMEEAVLQISRRYNLNKAQEEYTRLLLVKRVRAFLDKYEPDVRELLKESIDLRLGKMAGTPEAYAKWAIRAAPIYAEAQKAILEGNEEWRAVLNDDQKKIHDNDLAQMRSNFQNVDRLLEGWKSGKGPVIAQGGQTIQSGAGATVQGRVSDPQVPITRQQAEDNWLAYVNKFISTYKLDEKQKIAARDKIYKDIREEVNKYREKMKSEFKKLDAEALSPKSKPQDVQRRRIELEKPIRERFVLLDSRLRQLVDRKQLADADRDEERQLEAWFKMLSGQVGEQILKAKEPAHPEKGNGDKPPAAKADAPIKPVPVATTQPAPTTPSKPKAQ